MNKKKRNDSHNTRYGGLLKPGAILLRISYPLLEIYQVGLFVE